MKSIILLPYKPHLLIFSFSSLEKEKFSSSFGNLYSSEIIFFICEISEIIILVYNCINLSFSDLSFLY